MLWFKVASEQQTSLRNFSWQFYLLLVVRNSQMDPFNFLIVDTDKLVRVITDLIKKDPVDFHLDRISKLLWEAMNKTVPKYELQNSLCYVVTPIIKKLQSKKSKLLTTIKKHNRLECVLPLQ